MYVDTIVRELRQQVGIARLLSRRVNEGEWVVTSEDLEVLPYGMGGVQGAVQEPVGAYSQDVDYEEGDEDGDDVAVDDEYVK